MYKLFSRRQKELNGEISDVFEYEHFSKEFRIQVFYILFDLANLDSLEFVCLWKNLSDAFKREKGWKNSDQFDPYSSKECEQLIEESNNEDFLDFLDFSFYMLDTSFREHFSWCTAPFDEAIAELNERFKHHNFGYEFANGKIIRIDNRILHNEVVKPSLQLLYDLHFSGANQEMMNAYEFRRLSNNKSAIIEATKAFESTMKAICDGMKYPYNAAKDTAKTLIKTLVDNQFFPSYLNAHISGIQITLESGAPTVRNKTSGHGQGAQVMQIPDEYVDYTLNLVATNIVFLAKLYESQKVTET